MARPNRDGQHLERLRDLFARERCLPSYQDIASALGFQTKNAAFKLVHRLIESGHVSRAMGGRLAPGPNFFLISISADEVRAGIDADRQGTGLFDEQRLTDLFATRPSRTILVRVLGESMVGAGILSGDLAVVETGVEALSGEFVVAEIDGAHTIKEYKHVGGRGVLASHGGHPSVITPEQTLRVIGVVRGIVRAYKPTTKRTTKLAKHGVSR
jgi:repressor LexA